MIRCRKASRTSMGYFTASRLLIPITRAMLA